MPSYSTSHAYTWPVSATLGCLGYGLRQEAHGGVTYSVSPAKAFITSLQHPQYHTAMPGLKPADVQSACMHACPEVELHHAGAGPRQAYHSVPQLLLKSSLRM